MIRSIVPFRRWHYAWLLEHGQTAEYGAMILSPGVLEQVEAQNTWTAVADGVPVAIAGTYLLWPGRHMAWAHLSFATGPIMGWITTETQKRLEVVPGRIELTVLTEFEAGHRWAKLLGFQVETPCLKQYGPNGESHTGYVRFN